MLRYLVVYIMTGAVFLVIDFIWLSKVAKSFYTSQLGDLLLESPRLGIAGLFYALYVVGIAVFAVLPALRDGSLINALMLGGLFGFMAYATYDVTNYATLKGWPVTVVLVDIAWGTILTALAAAGGYIGTRWLYPA